LKIWPQIFTGVSVCLSLCATAGLLLWVHGGTDRQTDTIPFHKLCSAYYMGSANNDVTNNNVLVNQTTLGDSMRLMGNGERWSNEGAGPQGGRPQTEGGAMGIGRGMGETYLS